MRTAPVAGLPGVTTNGIGCRRNWVSVIIPAFNSEETIERTLASALSQTGVSFEVIVVDSGSTDRTAELVERIARSDARVRLYRQANLGIAAARNRAVRESIGEWIAPLDADDIWYPGNLEQQLHCGQEAGAGVAVVYSWSLEIDADDRALSRVSASSIRGDVFLTLLCHNFLGNGSCTLIRRSAFDEVGGYDCDRARCEDWDLYLRLAELYHFAPVNRFLVGYRQSPRSASHNYEWMAQGHAAMLDGARRRNSKVPPWLCRLSESNLYIYLARRQAEDGAVGPMREWLRRAAAAHRLALLRPDWWSLFAIARRNSGSISAARLLNPDTVSNRARSVPRVIASALLHGALRQLA